MMKKKLLMLLPSAAILLLTSSCSSKLGTLSADNFSVTPSPLEAHSGQVAATIDGRFPEKYMNKKAVVTVTPQLRFSQNGTQQTVNGQPATFQGERVLGNDQTVSYLLGGHYTMKSIFDYQPAMQQSELYLVFDARIGKKAVSVPPVKVADGVVATSELYRRTLTSAQPCLAQDAFQRVTAQRLDANVKFLIQQAQLRKSELKNNSVQEFVKLLQRISRDPEGLNLASVEVAAYASPDGGVQLNERLASQRRQSSEQYVQQQLRAAGLNGSVDARYTAQDWEGFQQLVMASDIQDKEVILRVLSMYQDPEEREQQIRNMSAGFTELADGILPELRRARLTVNYEVIGRDDDQIRQQLASDPTQLTVEEMLYAATLTTDAAEQQRIYEQTARLYPTDARALNNLGVLAYQQGDYERARQLLTQAQTVNAQLPEAQANLGLIALQQGNKAEAESLIGRATNANGLAEALGNLHLAQGNYALAEQDFGNIRSNSAALAQLMNKDYAKAAQTLAAIRQPDALTDYLGALLSARQGNTSLARQLKSAAMAKDPSLATYAEHDLELK